MSRPTPVAADSNVLAALHQAGRSWRAVAAKREGGRIRVLDSREFRPDEQGRIDDWLTQHRVSRTICVLPASSVICRTATLPGASLEQLGPALRLQAETFMLGTAPAHRQAMAVLHAAPGETSRAGLIVAWPERTKKPAPPTTKPLTYAPDVACLAALMNGARSNDPIMWTDRTDGSIALALSHPQGAVFRASCENSDDDQEWRSSVNRLLAETAMTVGHTETFTESLIAGTSSWLSRLNGVAGHLFLPASVAEAASSRLEGAGSEPLWWSKYGVASGALLATLDQLEPLTAIRDELPVEKPSRLASIASALSTRRAAAFWSIIAFLVVGVGPLIFNGARVAVYAMRVGNLEEYQDELKRREKHLVMYEELGRHTWPVAKVISDVVNCAPVGVSITSINVDVDGDEVAIQGEADSESIANDMGVRLADSGVFSDVAVGFNNREQGTSKFKITITAKVKGPYLLAEYEDDFAVEPLGRRIHGPRFVWEPRRRIDEPTGPAEGGGDEVAGGGADDGSDGPSDGDSAQPRNAAGNRGDFGRTGPRTRPSPNLPSAARGGAETKKIEMPPLLTSDDVAKLDHTQAQQALLKVIQVKENAQFTDEQRAQLKEQYDLLLKRMREASPLNN